MKRGQKSNTDVIVDENREMNGPAPGSRRGPEKQATSKVCDVLGDLALKRLGREDEGKVGSWIFCMD